MRKIILPLFLLLLLIGTTACANPFTKVEPALNSKPEAAYSPAIQEWLKTADLNADEGPDELYHKALSEDTLVIYSNSTRMMDVKESFEKQYPGLTVYVEDIRSVDLLDKLSQNFAQGKTPYDLIFCDDNGMLSQKLFLQGAVFTYIPPDMAKSIPSLGKQSLLPVVIELQQAFYNPSVYATPPIHNWWELTEEKYKGKVVMPSPFKSNSSMAFFSMILKNNDIMADSYYRLYHKKLPLLPNETAGEAFWRMLFDNGLVLVNSSDEVYEMVGTPDQADPPIGIMISSKIRMKSLGYQIEPIFDMDGFSGVYSSNDIMLAGGCKNINSAKLFVRWILGESDGQGEGYKPYLQNGAWSARNDVLSESEKSLDEIDYLPLDTKYMYDNQESIDSFINELLSHRTAQ